MPAVQQATGIEGICDALADIFGSFEFDEFLQKEHARQRAKIPYRRLEYVYTDDKETLDGYPCLELISTVGETQGDSPQIEWEISAQFTVNGTVEEMMGREVKRFLAATRYMFRNTSSLMPYFGGSPVRTGRIELGPIVGARNPTPQTNWIKSGSIELFINSYS